MDPQTPKSMGLEYLHPFKHKGYGKCIHYTGIYTIHDIYGCLYTVDGSEILQTHQLRWGWWFLPIFIGFYIHQQYQPTPGEGWHPTLGQPRTHGPKMQVSKMGFPDQLGWIQSLGSSQSICFAGGSSRIYNNFPFVTKLAGGWVSTHLKNMRKSNWESFPQFSGWK